MAAIIAQLVVVYHSRESTDPFLSWPFAVTTSLAQSLGVISACVPYLRPFLASLDSGMIGNDDMRRRGQSGEDSSQSRLLKDTLLSANAQKGDTKDDKISGGKDKGAFDAVFSNCGNEINIVAEGTTGRERSDKESQFSTAGILRTTNVDLA